MSQVDPSRRAATAARTPVRMPQIQALRCVAVLSVIVYHFWPEILPGGYTGVDVFFVISGYLMTSSILHLRHGSGGAGLGLGLGVGGTLREFYLRRLTRILPAATVTLLVSAALSLALVPLIAWPQTLREILAGAFFFENWALVADATDYLGGGGQSPVQHFWSLSVEEQFYAVWPWVVMLAAQAAPRVTARGRMVKLVAVLGALTVASLIYSIHLTRADPATAYFSTLTRFWELAFGGVVLVVDRYLRAHPAWRAGAGWLGLGLIGWTLATYTDATPFPGWRAAVPLVGTALVIMGSPASAPWGPVRLLGWRPVQVVGDLSYSLYLLHWPLYVFAGRWLARPLSDPELLLLLVVVLGLAALMKRHVEDRFRLTRPAATPAAEAVDPRTDRARGVRRTIGFVVVTQLAVVAVTGAGLWHHRGLVDQAAASVASFTDSPARKAACYAAISAKRASQACPPMPASVLDALPSPLVSKTDWPYDRCQQRGEDDQRCDLLTGSSGRLVIGGDSHIVQWIPAILPWARRHDLSVTTFVKSGCVLTSKTWWGTSCASWNTKVWADIQALDPDYVMTSALSAFTDAEVPDRAAGLLRRWRQIVRGGAQLVAFRDIPQPKVARIGDMAACLVQHRSTAACRFSRSLGLSRDYVAPAARELGVPMVDLASYFCPQRVCQPIQHGILVWIDTGHMSSWWSRGLADVVGRRLDRITGLSP